MSTAWLIRPAAWTLSLVPPANIEVIEVDLASDNLDRLVAEREILITSDIHLSAEFLQRCRWIRGIIGVGDRSRDVVDLAFARHAGLQAEVIPGVEVNASVLEQVVTSHRRIEEHLRGLDDIAEHWEGT